MERVHQKRSSPTLLGEHFHYGATSSTFPISSKTTTLPSTTNKLPSCTIYSLTYLFLLLLSRTLSPQKRNWSQSEVIPPSLEKIKKKNVANPLNFRSAPMVTTFVCSVGSRTQFLDEASQPDVGMRLAGLQHSSLKKMFAKC